MATIIATVYRYGTPARFEMPGEAVEQLHLAYQLRHTLVELTRQHEQAMRTLWSGNPTVAAAESRIDETTACVEQLVRQVAEERVADRSAATRPDTAAALAAARVQARTARVARRDAIHRAYPLVKADVERLRTDHNTAVKVTYADFVQQRGLYWATYNGVVDDHRATVKAVEARRKQGQSAELRSRRWTGEGTIRVQLQRSSGQPPRTPALLASGGGSWRKVFQLRPWVPAAEWAAMSRAEQRRAGRGEAVLCIGGGRMITVPVQVHRMLPDDADIVEVQLTRRRTAGNWSLQVTVTVRLPDPPPVTEGPRVAVHVGWRSRPHGAVRVATWASSDPLPVPGHLADVVTADDAGSWGEIVVRPATSGPGRWMGIAERPGATRSARDVGFAPARAEVARWLDEHPQPDPRPEDPERLLTGARVRAWRAPGRLAALALRWRQDPPPGAEVVMKTLEAWRRQDRQLWEWEAHERAQVANGRDDAWRRVGSWLASLAGLVLVDDANLAVLRQRDDATEDDPVLPGDAARAARARATLMAPGRLRQAVTEAAGRRGVPVQVVAAAGLSRTHAVCGRVGARDGRYAASVMVICTGCGQTYDQDRNATVLMLAAASVDPGALMG